jgi:hypothetical protein
VKNTTIGSVTCSAIAVALTLAPAAHAESFVDSDGRRLCNWMDTAKMAQSLAPADDPIVATPQQVMNAVMDDVMRVGYSSSQARSLIAASVARFCPNGSDWLVYTY